MHMTYVVPTAAQSPCKCAARTKLSHQRDIGSLIPPTLQYTTPPEERVRRIQDAHNTLHNPRREIRIQYAHTALHTPGERTTPTLHYTPQERELGGFSMSCGGWSCSAMSAARDSAESRGLAYVGNFHEQFLRAMISCVGDGMV